MRQPKALTAEDVRERGWHTEREISQARVYRAVRKMRLQKNAES